MNADEPDDCHLLPLITFDYQIDSWQDNSREILPDPRWMPAPSTSGARCLQRVSWPWIAKSGKSCTNASMEEFRCPRSGRKLPIFVFFSFPCFLKTGNLHLGGEPCRECLRQVCSMAAPQSDTFSVDFAWACPHRVPQGPIGSSFVSSF